MPTFTVAVHDYTVFALSYPLLVCTAAYRGLGMKSCVPTVGVSLLPGMIDPTKWFLLIVIYIYN